MVSKNTDDLEYSNGFIEGLEKNGENDAIRKYYINIDIQGFEKCSLGWNR